MSEYVCDVSVCGREGEREGGSAGERMKRGIRKRGSRCRVSIRKVHTQSWRSTEL